MENGKKLNGRYRIIRTIGSGGMANVYLAHDLILDREVAVKVLRYDFRNDEDTIRRFKREALSATELVHPNIVGIYDVGEENDMQYIVMEYIKGMDLKEYIQNQFPIPYRKVLNIMEQILSAVAYAHQNHLIHRDLKPQNILMDENGIAKITDFGIAVAVSQSSITQTNTLLGSVHYLSPEQARGSMATNQSDIYSLGIILYELLTGHVPFDGESAVSIALKHFQENVPSVKKFDSRIPQALENVVLKATAKEIADRYKTVNEMASDLETSMSPQRADEPPFKPTSMTQDTIVIAPIPASQEPVSEDTMVIPVIEADEVKSKEEVKTKPKKKKKRRWIWVLLAILFFITVGVVTATYLMMPKDVTIPDVANLTVEDAEEQLEAAKLAVDEVFEEPNEEIEEGLVVRSNPNIGNSVKENSQVDLYVSSGKATVNFKDFIGEDYQEVRAALTEQGFTVESTEESSDTVSAGAIISQDIEEDEEVVPSETTVSFIISSGRAGFEMIDLNGYSKTGVENYAEQRGMNLEITEEYSDEVPAGSVVSQNIDPGTLAYAGDIIKVVISLGQEEIPEVEFTIPVTIPYQTPEESASSESESSSSEESESESESSAPEPEPNTIEVYIQDAEHSIDTLFQRFTITENTESEIPFILEEGAKGSYRIVRDGETIEENNNVTPPETE